MDLGGVVAAADEVEPVLLGEIEPFFAEFAGDERVDAGGKEVRHGAVARTAAEGDELGRGRTALDGDDARVELLQPGAQLGALELVGGDPADELVLVGQELAPGLEAQLAGHDDVVADLFVRVERQVAGIDCTVAAHEGGKAAVDRAGQRLDTAPEQAVVSDDEIHATLDGALEGHEPGVHRGADTHHATVVGDLQTVDRPRVVLEGRTPGAFVAIVHELLERGHGRGGWGRDLPRASRGWAPVSIPAPVVDVEIDNHLARIGD